VFAARQILQKLLKNLLINYLLFTQPDRQLERSGRTMVKLTGDRQHKPCPERYAEADTKLLRPVAVLAWGIIYAFIGVFSPKISFDGCWS